MTGGKQLNDAIFGLAIADAVGVPYEFQQRGTFQCRDMVGYGSHNQPAGTWSDDTSMTLATLMSIKRNNGRINIEDIRSQFLLWINKSKYTANGDVFDIGHTKLKALMHNKPGAEEYENGNGSLMRILPLAFTDCTDQDIEDVSAITHSNWISKKSCVIYVHVAKRLLNGEKIENIIPGLMYDKPFDRLHIINQLEETDIKSSGYVISTLEAALWTLSTADWNEDHSAVLEKNYTNDVLKAVNLGDDTDTAGAVTGGLAGIIYGLDSVSKKWMNTLRNKELIHECLW